MSAARTSSLQRFKAMTKDLQQEIKQETIKDLNAAADALVATMRAAAPLGPTGNLRKSIRKEKGKNDLRVKVMAGGPLTTTTLKRTATYQRAVKLGSGDTAGIARGGGFGVTYDYSRAVEFGTEGAPAKPFFWTTWRAGRKKIRSRIKRKISANVKKRSAV